MREPIIEFDGKFYNITIPHEWLLKNNFSITLNPFKITTEKETHDIETEEKMQIIEQDVKHRRLWREL